jgi:hypothetical protein
MVKKEKGEIEKGVQKKIYKENKDLMKKVQ